MKKLFTKICSAAAVCMALVGATLQANAQYTIHVLGNDVWCSAVAKDGNGDIFVVEPVTESEASAYGKVIEYAANGTSSTIYNGASDAILFTDCDGDNVFSPQGIAVTANGDVYVTTAYDPLGSCVTWGNIVKIPCTSLNSNGPNTYGAPTTFLAGNSNIGLFETLAVDNSNNLYCYLYDASGNGGANTTAVGLPGSYEVEEFPATNNVPVAANAFRLNGSDGLKLNVTAWNSSDAFIDPTGLTVDGSGNVYVADPFDFETGAYSGKVYKLTKGSGNSYTASTFITGQFTSALGMDASGNLYAVNDPGLNGGNNLQLIEYPNANVHTVSTQGTSTTLYTTLGSLGPEEWYPNTIAAVNSGKIYVDNGSSGGSDNGDFDELTGPTISSLIAGSTYTNSSSETFTLTFSQAITGVTSSAFSLTTTGSVTGASVGTPTTSNNITWSVPVNTGTGDGTITLNVANSAGFDYGVSTTLPYTGGTTTVDKTAPTITIGSPSVSSIIAGSGSVTYTVSYFDANFNSSTLSSSNITLNATGGASGTIAVSGSGTTRTVTISSITGAGTLGISIAAGTASDLAGNTAPGAGPSTTFTVLQPTITVPGGTTTLTSTTSGTPGPSTSFNISATNLSPASGSLTITAPTNVQVSPDNGTWNSSYTQSYSGSTVGSTPVYVRLAGTGSLGTISGNVSVSGGGAATVTQAVSGRLNSPSTTISSLTAVSSTTTNASSVQYTATFAASVTGLTIGDFSLNSSGVSGATVSSVSGSGTSWTITVNTGSGDGTIQLVMNSSSGVSPSVSNLSYNGDTYTIDKTAPTVTIGAPSVSYANSSTTVSFTATWSDANLNTNSISLNPATFVYGGSGYSLNIGNVNITGSGATRTISFTGISGDGTFNFAIPAGSASDNAGNSAGVSNTTAGVTIDNTAPTVTVSAPSVTSIGTGTSGTVSYTVTYSDANFNSSNLTSSGITLNTSGTANGTVGVSGSGTSYTVTISGITGSGSLGISVGAGYSSDLAGNSDAGAGPSTPFNVLNNDATLSNLVLNPGGVMPAFSSGTTAYADSVGHTVSNITVTPTTNDPSATAVVTINGVTENSGAINIGDNNVVVTVTAADGVTTDTYTVRVGREGSHAAGLAYLTVSGAPLSPGFTTAGTSYTASVPYNNKSVTVTPSVIDPTSTVTVNGVAVSNKTASAPIALNVGSNTITVVVTAQDGMSSQTYTVTVTREQNTNAYLANLSLSNGAALSPAFSVHNMSYTSSVSASTVSSVTVTASLIDPNATIMVNGSPVANKTASGAITLPASTTTPITVVVTAADGVTTQTYTVNVTSVLSSNANLQGLYTSKGAISPGFAADINSYSLTVPSTASSINITAKAADAGATVTVNSLTSSTTTFGPIALNFGSNTITVLVTAADGTQNNYTITVTRPFSSEAYLASMSLSNGAALSPAFAATTFTYSASVSNKISSVTLTANVIDPNATFTVNTAPGTPKVASAPIALAVGPNTITVVVTAQDGVTTQTYTVTVTRAMGSMNTVFQPVGVEQPDHMVSLADDGILVHQGVSPNGDGVNDFLQIDNISQYPDNKLSIMNRNGQLIYEATGYDNSSKVFDGHSNKNGQLQQPGTYFYQLDYVVAGIAKHKTGYIVLKY